MVCFGLRAEAQNSKLLRGGMDISSSSIHHITCDRDGIIWVSTDNGINRMDGAKNRQLFNTEGGNSFNYVFHDRQNRHWFCGSDNVYLYDEAADRMVPVSTYTLDGHRVPVRVSMMLQRKDGTLLVCSAGHGVMKLVEENGEMQFQQVNPATMKKERSPYFYVSIIEEDNKGNLWLTSEKGIITVRNGKMVPVQCGDASKDRHYSFIRQSKDGYVWCGNNAGGVWRIDPTTLQTAEVPALSNIGVGCIVTNRTTEVLVGTNANGIWQIDSKTLSAFQHDVIVGNRIDNRLNVHALEDDMHGNLWIGCYQKGIVILSKQEDRFRYIGKNNINGSIIGDGCVMSLGRDSQNRLWVASDGDGMYMLSGGTSVAYRPSAQMPSTVMTQLCDSKGRMWLGTWLQGLWVMNTQTGKANKVELPIKGSSYSVFALHEDSRGRIWIGTLGDGLFCLDADTGKITVAPRVKSGLEYGETKNVIPNNFINDFSKGPGDILFLATCDGIGAINTSNNDCLKTLHGKNRMFGGVNVNTVLYTNDNRLWIGTNTGLYVLDLKTLNVRHIKHEDGLLGNMVQSITDTGKGEIWVSTNAGVTRVRLSDDNIINFSSYNGMYGNEFSRNAALLMPDGNLWLGGNEGVAFFNPKDVARPGAEPKFFVTGLYVNGNYVTTGTESEGNRIISEDIMHCSEIELAYSDNCFTLEFSTLNYMSNDAMTYEYRIDNGQWQVLPAGANTASFNNLKPGSYKIAIRAMQHGQYSEERIISVRIHGPWYTSWLAYIFYCLIIALAIAAFIMRIRHKHREAITNLKLRQQEEMADAKMQYFMNISHEIRTPMTLIISPLQRLIAVDKDPDRQAAYRRMNLNAHRILNLVNQMLDVRKIDKGQMKLTFSEVDMVPYLGNLIDTFHDMCESKQMSFVFNCSQSEVRAWIDPLNFEKVIANLLSNSVKFTQQGGKIEVSLTSTDKELTIRVEDNGSGIDESEKEHIFDRFYQQNNKTSLDGMKAGSMKNAIQGTGIGLNLTHSLVQMHHGTITCDNNEDGKPGCHFVVTLPMGRAHLKDNEIADSKDIALPTPAAKKEQEAVEGVDVAQTASAATTAKPKTRKRVLIVEDDPEISSYLAEELSRDFIVTVCANGQEALDAILHKPNTRYELVISDVMMPVMDGLELLRQIRQNTNINSIPVILLTARITDQDNIEALQCGADAYITKPYNIEVVRNTAKNLILRQGQLKNIYSGSQNRTIESKIKVVSPDEKLMQRIMKVINENLDNPELGNDLITREVGISRVHLYRKLKELTNLSLRDFIRNIRLNEAARLLSEQKHSIAEIAARTGFENVSYFTVVFKQKYGVPPSQYRGQNAEN